MGKEPEWWEKSPLQPTRKAIDVHSSEVVNADNANDKRSPPKNTDS